MKKLLVLLLVCLVLGGCGKDLTFAKCDWHLQDGVYGVTPSNYGYYCIWCRRQLSDKEYEYGRKCMKEKQDKELRNMNWEELLKKDPELEKRIKTHVEATGRKWEDIKEDFFKGHEVWKKIKREEKDEEKPFICNNCGIGGGHLSTCPIWD